MGGAKDSAKESLISWRQFKEVEFRSNVISNLALGKIRM